MTVDTDPGVHRDVRPARRPRRGDRGHHARRGSRTRSRSAGRPTAEVIGDDQVHQIVATTRPTAGGSRSAPPPPCRTAPQLTISIGPGTPSAEGPRTTTQASTHTADHLLRARGHRHAVRIRRRAAGPDPTFTITFNNALDAKAFDSEHGHDHAGGGGVDRRIGQRRSRSTARRSATRATSSTSRRRCATSSARRWVRPQRQCVRRRRGNARADAVPAAAHHHRSVGDASRRCR